MSCAAFWPASLRLVVTLSRRLLSSGLGRDSVRHSMTLWSGSRNPVLNQRLLLV